jgi:hypothetical protein
MNRHQRRMLRKGERRQIVVHPMILEVARGFANEIYEELCLKDNEFYARCPNREAWVTQAVPELLPKAREILANMLGRVSVPDAQKEEIYDALVKDGSLPRHLGLQ